MDKIKDKIFNSSNICEPLGAIKAVSRENQVSRPQFSFKKCCKTMRNAIGIFIISTAIALGSAQPAEAGTLSNLTIYDTTFDLYENEPTPDGQAQQTRDIAGGFLFGSIFAAYGICAIIGQGNKSVSKDEDK